MNRKRKVRQNCRTEVQSILHSVFSSSLNSRTSLTFSCSLLSNPGAPHEKRAANLLPRREVPWHSSWQSGRKSLNTVQRVLRTIVYQGIPRILSLGRPLLGPEEGGVNL